jgi:sodium/hydrogen antiporter
MATTWFLLLGTLFILMALIGTVLRRLPLSPGVVYLLIGFALGQQAMGLIALDPIAHSALLERVTEIAVLISLFTVGLKLRVPIGDRIWRLPLKLALNSMALTIALVAGLSVVLLDLPLGAAIVLGAILAPTDPVLASEVQVRDPGDRDQLRFSLTGEGGLNDGVALPFVLLGLGLLGEHHLGPYAATWIVRDVLWAAASGLSSGWLCGLAIGKLVVYLRREYREALGLDEFLVLGTIAFAYGLAQLVLGNGFLAVFAAGLALRNVEHRASGAAKPHIVIGSVEAGNEEETATHRKTAPAYMTESLLGFNQQLERIVEFAVVLIVGAMLTVKSWTLEASALAMILFLFVRPVAVALGTLGSSMSSSRRRLTCWFGIRGVGSVYYLMYAVEHALPPATAERLIALVLPVVAASIVLHGVSATPLMQWYQRRRQAA